MITSTVDTARFDRKMADLPARMAAAKKRALEAIGEAVVSRTTLAFRTPSIRPLRWEPRKPSKRDDGHPLLIKSGTLRKSFQWRLDGSDAVVVGTDREYAPYLQFGTKHMPARPFFPVTQYGRLTTEMEDKIVRTVDRIYKEELGELGKG